MKLNNFILLAFVMITITSNAQNTVKPSLDKFEGQWKSNSCESSFLISKAKSHYHYLFKSKGQEIKGIMLIKHNGGNTYFTFENFKWTAKGNQKVNNLQLAATYYPKNNKFVIQNTGNSTNYYVKLGECDKKYITFKKQYSKKEKQAVLTQLMAKQFADYSLFDWVEGDINKDNIPDFIVVLQAKKPDEDNSFVRKTVLVETIAFPQLKIAATNDNVVQCSNCGGGGVGDPYQLIVIKNNYFSIEEFYGACCKDRVITTFKYSPKTHNWVLHKKGTISYCCNQKPQDGEILTTTTIKTQKDFGIILFKDFSL